MLTFIVFNFLVCLVGAYLDLNEFSECLDGGVDFFEGAALNVLVGDGVVVFEFYEFVKVVKFDFSLSEEHLFVDAQFFVRDAVSPLLDHFVGGLDALFEQLW